jgi:hypothetical protein
MLRKQYQGEEDGLDMAFVCRNEKFVVVAGEINFYKFHLCRTRRQKDNIVLYNIFDQSNARLSKHFPTCNNTKKTVFSMWSAPSNNMNSVLCDQLLGYAIVLTTELFSV